MEITLRQKLESIVTKAITNAPLHPETDITPLVEFTTDQIEQLVRELVEEVRPIPCEEEHDDMGDLTYDIGFQEGVFHYRDNLLSLLTSTDEPEKDS